MTPTEIETASRELYNSIGDSFFSSAEILNYMTQASRILAQKAEVIERVYTTTTTAGTQEYSWPTNAIAIKRITYEGNKLKSITFREDDQLTVNNTTTTATGTPQYYALWNNTFYLRPVPAAVGTLKIYSYNQAQALTTTSVLEVPTMFHMQHVDYIVHRMAMKDGNGPVSSALLAQWQEHVKDALAWKRKQKYSDGFPGVSAEEGSVGSYLGIV